MIEKASRVRIRQVTDLDHIDRDGLIRGDRARLDPQARGQDSPVFVELKLSTKESRNYVLMEEVNESLALHLPGLGLRR